MDRCMYIVRYGIPYIYENVYCDFIHDKIRSDDFIAAKYTFPLISYFFHLSLLGLIS